MGTTEYMAPEQASDSRTAEVRADIYSLGGTLCKLLTGRVPPRGSEAGQAFGKRLTDVLGPVPPTDRFPAEVPEGLAAIVDRMRAKNPADRFATAAEAAAALGPWCVGADLPALLRRAARPENQRVLDEGRRCRRTVLPTWCRGPRRSLRCVSWKPIAILVALLLLLVGVGVFLGIMVRTQKDGVPVTARIGGRQGRQCHPEDGRRRTSFSALEAAQPGRRAERQ